MLFATNGATLEIGGVLAMKSSDFVASDFNAISWTEITGMENLGSVGDESAEISQDIIGESRTKRIKGTRNAPPMQIVYGINYDDAGQQALIAAEKTIHDYAFRLTFNDAPPGGTPSKRLFIAKVASVTEALDTANNTMKGNSSLWVNSNLVRISAAISGSVPDNTVLPAITGTAQDGETLSASTGTWTGSPTPEYSYQWYRDGEAISGATASTYDVVTVDVGAVLSVMVTATNVNGTLSAMSADTVTVIAAP